MSRRPCWLTIWLKTRNTISFNFEIWIIFHLCLQTKPNQFSVSYHIAQYTNIIADLRKEIFRLKLKISEHGEESGDGSSRKSKPRPRRQTCLDDVDDHDGFNKSFSNWCQRGLASRLCPMEFVRFVESRRNLFEFWWMLALKKTAIGRGVKWRRESRKFPCFFVQHQPLIFAA